MPKTGRRTLLKMLGLSPALMIPWKRVTEQVVPSPPAPTEPKSFDVDAMKLASGYTATACMGSYTFDEEPY